MKTYTLDYKGHVITVQINGCCIDLLCTGNKIQHYYLTEDVIDGYREYNFITADEIENKINLLKGEIDNKIKHENNAVVHMEKLNFKEQEKL